MKKKNLPRYATTGITFSLIAFLGAQNVHEPGHFPTPPYPPHAHIEADSNVSSAPSVSPAFLASAITEVRGDVSIPLTGEVIDTQPGYMHVLTIS